MVSTPRATSADAAHTPSTLSSTGKAAANSSEIVLGDVELSNVQNGSANPPNNPLECDIMQCARLGETGLIQKMLDTGRFNAQYKDAEGITPLHWAAINNQYATCDFLIKAGADVNAKGGESGATPAMWAAQRCHYYVVNLLLQSGTDPLLVDGQGYNILHLATIDGNAFLLVLLLHQEIPVDTTDPQGHTSLMWAAYKGFPACVDLLLRWGANVNATDEKGLNPLHWALVKGSQPCIQKVVEYGVDRFARTLENKTPATVADEMRSTRMWHRALSECGYDEDGNPKTLPLGLTSLVKDRRVMAKFFFLWPFLSLWVAISILSGMPIYAGLPITVVVSFVLQKLVVYLAQWGPSDYRHIHHTPFLAGVFAGTLFWVGIRWVFSIVPITFTSHPVFNIVFATSYGLTTYYFFTSLLEDPGYVPKLASRNSQKKAIEELFSLWKFDEDNFCVLCMIRKPLRSKHCRRCGRCVAKHDHHCPWINNCVGNNNLRHFVLYLLSMEIGVIIFIRLVLLYIDLLPSPPSNEIQCNILPPNLCSLLLRDPWTIILSLWTSLQLIWITMLLVVQFVQISRNQTTYENMKRHIQYQPQTQIGGVVTAGLVSGSSSLGPEGAGVLGSSNASGSGARRKKEGFFSQWTKLLGLDAFVVTASDTSATANGRRRRRGNPYSRGVVTNCRDFWCDSTAPYFGTRKTGAGMGVGEGMLDGQVVDYARLYDVPIRTTGRGGGWWRGRAGRGRRDGGMRYQVVGDGGGEEDGEGV